MTFLVVVAKSYMQIAGTSTFRLQFVLVFSLAYFRGFLPQLHFSYELDFNVWAQQEIADCVQTTSV